MEDKNKKTEIDLAENFIKKTSLNLYLLIKEIENIDSIEALKSKKIIDEIKAIDKNLLNHFKIKFSEKQKNQGFQFMELMKK